MTMLDQMITSAFDESVELTAADTTLTAQVHDRSGGPASDARMSKPKPTHESHGGGGAPSGAGAASGEIVEDDDRRGAFEWLGDQVEQGVDWVEATSSTSSPPRC